MNRFLYIIASVLGLWMVSACNSDVAHDRLLQAEAIMEKRPDSALVLLDSLRSSPLMSDIQNSESDNALYALLRTQALIKNNLIPTNDSLISVAAMFYHGKNDSNEMKSIFYQGDVRLYNNEYSAAIIPAIKARQLAIELGNDYWHAKSSEMIADIYDASYYNDTIYRCEAIQHYLRAGKINNHRYSICDLAINKANYGNINEAIHLLDSIIQIAEESNPSDTSLMIYGYQPLLASYLKAGKEREASNITLKLNQLNDFDMRSTKDYVYHAQNAINNKQYNDAYDLLEKAEQLSCSTQDSITLFIAFSDFYKSTGSIYKSKDYSDSLIIVLNKEINRVINQSIFTAQRDYFSELSQRETQKSRNLLIIIVLIIITCVIILILGFIIYHLHIKLKNKELYCRITDIKALSYDLITFREIVNDNCASKEILFNKYLHILDNLCQKYYEIESKSYDNKRIEDKVSSEIEKLRQKHNFKLIEYDLNNHLHGLITALREECGSLKESDIKFCALLFSGLSPKSISLLCDITLNNFYTKRKRLIEKIRNCNTSQADFFISKM